MVTENYFFKLPSCVRFGTDYNFLFYRLRNIFLILIIHFLKMHFTEKISPKMPKKHNISYQCPITDVTHAECYLVGHSGVMQRLPSPASLLTKRFDSEQTAMLNGHVNCITCTHCETREFWLHLRY